VDNAGLSTIVSVLVKIDKTPPVASNPTATPNPVSVSTSITLASTITDNLSGVASAAYNIDGGAFSAMTGNFGGTTANVTATIPAFAAAGFHTICVRGTDIAGNLGTSSCTQVVIFDPNGGFVTGGGTVNVPAGTDLANPTASGQVSFSLDVRYLPKSQNVPSGSFEVQFPAGNIDFQSTTLDYLVMTSEPRARVQGSGTINGTVSCKFQFDAWNGSFVPGKTDAFGVKIYQCSDGHDPRFNLPTAPLSGGQVQTHK
jgi:hypothetical protein